MRHWSVKFCSRAFTIVVLHVCFPVKWKEGRKGPHGAKFLWAKACGGNGGIQGARWAGSPQPAESRTMEKESDSHKLIQHFNKPSLRSVSENHCALCFPEHRYFCPLLFRPFLSPPTIKSLEWQKGYTVHRKYISSICVIATDTNICFTVFVNWFCINILFCMFIHCLISYSGQEFLFLLSDTNLK